MSNLYDRVAKLCEERGFSITALCRNAHVSPGILSDLKTGRKKTINVETATKLANALDVSADLLTGSDSKNKDPLIAFYGEVKDLLDDHDKDDLIAFMRMKAELKQYDKNRNDGTGTR